MKLKEALPLLDVVIRPQQHWVKGKGWVDKEDEYEVRTTHGQSYSGDRKLLESNFESDIEYMDNIGPMGLIGFKMRNNQRAVFLFNLMGDIYTIIRVKSVEYIERYKYAKKLILEGKDYGIESEEFDSWLTLKTIGGGRL